MLKWSDDQFFFIAGYTSGGAPYGVTREEMGLYPYEEYDDEVLWNNHKAFLLEERWKIK